MGIDCTTGRAANVCLPGGRVVQIEDHDEAYEVWRIAAARDRVLVHVDAHHDMWWCDGRSTPTIANFVCAALKDDLIGEVYWVVPDATWQHRSGRNAVRRHLRSLAAKYPGGRPPLEAAAALTSTRLLGKQLTVCSLGALPRIAAPVLLDIDVDFFVIPSVRFNEADEVSPLPWIWPADLLARLEAKQVRADLVTIASSVEGGYTPLEWKWLGDELASRLGGANDTRDGFEALRAGALAAERGDRVAAVAALSRAAAQLPTSAAPFQNLARVYLGMGREADAREARRCALARDSSYQTPYNNGGLRLYRERRYHEASAEWRQALALDPSDAHAHLGLARVAARQRRWLDAMRHATDALDVDPDLVDAHRILGRALAARRRYDDAIRAYEQSLRLTRLGRRTIAATPDSGGDGRLVDPDHFVVFARLGRLYAAKRDVAAAGENYRMALAGHCDGLRLRLGLAGVYVRQRRFLRGAREMAYGFKLIPLEIVSRWRRARLQFRRMRRRYARTQAA
jgi:tetratricopeptide (TPR) repeat protein